MEGDNSNLYRECMRNHAANLGSYATDGCGEFTLDDTTPGIFQCAACGCHRNFHRKLTHGGGGTSYTVRGGRDHHHQEPTGIIDYGGGGRHLIEESPESERMMMMGNNKKRFRSKFTEDQKEKMLAFAEKLGWKLQRKDEEDEVERFCRGLGINRKVFKVWMHNHKNNVSSSSTSASVAAAAGSNGNASSLTDQ